MFDYETEMHNWALQKYIFAVYFVEEFPKEMSSSFKEFILNIMKIY